MIEARGLITSLLDWWKWRIFCGVYETAGGAKRCRAEETTQLSLSSPPRYYVFLSFTAFDALPYPTAKSIIGVLLFGAHLSACQIHKPSCYCCKLKGVFVCMKQQSQASSIHLIQDQDQCDVLCTHVITCEGSFWETSCMQLSCMEHLVEIWKNLWGR
jgi:hypothetical protein